MLLDLFTGKNRAPADCVIKVRGSESRVALLYSVLIEVRVECSRKEAWVATLQFESRRDEHGKWQVQDAGVFLPWAEISIAATFGGTPQEIFNGYVKRMTASCPEDPGASTVTVECQDKSLALDRKHRRKNWADDQVTSDVAVLERILSEHSIGVSRDPKGGKGLSGIVLQQSSTDAAFLRARARANGYELIFECDSVYFGPMRLSGAPQPTIMVYAGPATHCLRFDAHDDAHHPDQVLFDIPPPQGSEPISRTVKPELERLGKEAADSSSAGLGPFAWFLDPRGMVNEHEIAAFTRGLANDHAMKIGAEGELDGSLYGHVLQVGQPVGVDGIGEWFGGVYYVDKVSHRFSIEGYRQGFTLLRNASGDNLPATSSRLAGIFC